MKMSFALFNQKIEDFMKEGHDEDTAIQLAGDWLTGVTESEDFELEDDVINRALSKVSFFGDEVICESMRIMNKQKEWRADND